MISVIFQLGPEYPARKDSQRKESDLQERFGCTGAHRVWRYKLCVKQGEESTRLLFQTVSANFKALDSKKWRSQKSCKSFFNLKIWYKLYLNVSTARCSSKTHACIWMPWSQPLDDGLKGSMVWHPWNEPSKRWWWRQGPVPGGGCKRMGGFILPSWRSVGIKPN